MKNRLALLLLFSVLIASPPAFGAEKWDCTLKDLFGVLPKGAKVSRTMEIDGEWLKWTAESPVIDSVGRPMQDRNGDYQHRTTTSRERILENNDVGIVAAFSQSQIDPQVGSIISAVITVIEKATGKFREGSVALNGAHDFFSGQCKRNSYTPTSNLSH
jgi:hypothetical protein